MDMDQSTYEDFLTRAELFRAANKGQDLIWYSALATSNFKVNQNRSGFRSLLGLIKYCLLELPWRDDSVTEDYDVVFASVFIKGKDKTKEAFFGDLPKLLSEDMKCAVVGKIAWNYKRSDEDMAQVDSDVDVFCSSHLLSKWDGLKCIWKSLTVHFSFEGMTSEQAHHARTDMQSARYHDIAIGLFYQKMLETLKAKNPNIQIIHAFEGNSWESACTIVDKNAVGYQHGAVLKDQIKMTPFKDRPIPSKIITSGAEASHAIVALTGMSSSHLVNGRALRLGRVYDHEPKAAYPKKIQSALFLMQNNEDENLKRLEEFHEGNPDLNIMLRPHPAHPIDRVYGFEVSKETDLYKDILRHDMCFYADSTAAFESIALGVPVLNLDDQSDPLFLCPAMRYQAKNTNDFEDTLKTIENSKNFDRDFADARAYFEAYFTKPTATMKDDFKKWLNLS